VEENVKLEVVDWGGTGRPLIFLASLGYNAHSYAPFIAKLVPNYHVYSLTRRGFSPSTIVTSESAYSSDRLGDDVAAIIDTLKIERPILVGDRVAGEELSSVGTRYPEKASGLIYLEAGYAYALYDQVNGDWVVSAIEAFARSLSASWKTFGALASSSVHRRRSILRRLIAPGACE